MVASRQVINQNHKHSKYLRKHYVPNWEHIGDNSWYYDVEGSHKADYLTNYQLLFSDDILWALEQLPSVWRETLLLHLAGYTNREITRISYNVGNLGYLSEEAIRSRLFRARKQMRRLIDENGKRRRV